MTTNPDDIRHLWTHKTQDHPFLRDDQLVIDRAEGVWVWTEGGKKLLDGFAGLAVVNVGHGRREIAEAIAEQTVRLAYYPTTRQFSNRPAAELAAKLAALTPGDLRYTMFAVSGSEANERSMQIARQYWLARGRSGKHKVISFVGGYHGATAGTFAVCGLPQLAAPYAPLQPAGFAKVAPPHAFRDRGTGTDAELVARRARELREAIEREGPETVSAVILEPILSSGGFIIPPLGWLRAVRTVCDEMDVLMIADEVITGFGRTGRWFGCDHEGVVPDLMSVAKGITSGYIPLSASIARPHLAAAFPDDTTQENVHPNTYAAHPVACAAALANLKIMEQDRLVENAETMGHASPRWPPRRGGEPAHRGRGARPRPDGLRGPGRSRWLGAAARPQAGSRPRPRGVGSGRHRLRAGQRPAAGAAAVHHGGGDGSARRRGGGQRGRAG